VSTYLGDFRLGDTFDFGFTTVDSTGLADANVVKVGPTGAGIAQTARDIGLSVITASVTNDVGITQAAADKVWATTTRALTDKLGFSLSAAGIQAIWDALTSALTTAGSVGKLIVDNLNAAISAVKAQTDKFAFTVANQVDANVLDWKSAVAPAMTGDAYARLGAPAGASTAADIAAVQADTTNIKTRLPTTLVSGHMDSSIQACGVSVIDAAALATDAAQEIATNVGAYVVEGSLTLTQFLRLCGAAAGGRRQGLGRRDVHHHHPQRHRHRERDRRDGRRERQPYRCHPHAVVRC
jgi:hypothetical protein